MKYFDKKSDRLVFINQKATADFWDQHWNADDIASEIKKGKNDKFVSKYTMKYIPAHKNCRVLEGGCGRGNFVYSLKLSGYDAYGIDFAEKTVTMINQVMPDLNITFGNVEKTCFPNSHFDGYWSLGVIEHFFNGYDKIANEMKRVIKPGGYLFLSFPYLSPLRKIKAKLGLYEKSNKSNLDFENFYQFALDHEKTIETFESLGFKIIEGHPFDGIKGLKDEVSFLKKRLQKIYDGNNLVLKIITAIISKVFAPFSSHSILLIFKKK